MTTLTLTRSSSFMMTPATTTTTTVLSALTNSRSLSPASLEPPPSMVPVVRKRSRTAQKTTKLLVFGTSGAGKSTLVRQMKVIGGGYDVKDRMQFVPAIQLNVVHLFEAVVNGAIQLDLFPSNKKNEANTLMFQALQCEFEPQLAQRMYAVWNSEPMQTAYHAHRHALAIPRAAKHFLDSCERISERGYVPSHQDIVLVDARANAITQSQFTLATNSNIKANSNTSSGHSVRVLDVGGQPRTRTEWVDCFSEVQVIVFVCALNEFNETVLSPSPSGGTQIVRNKLIESLSLFTEIANSRVCSYAAKVLVLNKRDLFDEKIKTSDLSTTFPEYTGGRNSENAISFIKHKFLLLIRDEASRNEVDVHVTSCGHDSDGVNNILESIQLSMHCNELAVALPE